ncbi:MAG TPA: protein kinase, partial [Bacteroidota bacterium]|nr:protein kinase [Bacteroidota bacterium]
QIARGLQYAHAKNVIHRDIKPENIKLLDDGRVKIIDFGIAKPYTPTASPEERSTSAVLTRMGMRIGTPWYMSPEQARGNPVDRRTDIFSFGVVLYELLTYAKPFQGDDTTVLYKILHEDPPPIKLEESGLTDDLQRILSRCLAKDHEERYGDCAEVLRDLVALTEGPSQDPRVRALLAQGIALDRAEKYDEAAARFNQILEIDPDNPQARAFLKRLSLRDREAFMRKVLAGDIIGTVISHFQILDRIGGGGMGVVYRAEDMSLKRIVALKFLMPDLVRDPSAKKRFLKEAQAASALDHPNICTIHEISETAEGLLFICMAFYGGENLSTRIAAGPLEPASAIDVVVRIGRGLAKAHEHGIVHRDIKPANVILTSEGEVKIVDFGLAKLSGGTQITRVGARMGTLPYMSPEQIRGNTLDHRTDIWSLGVLLFQTLTGQLPFQREYEAAMLYAIVTDDPPLLTSVKSTLPRELEEVITRALQKDPAARYASVQTMVEDLERIQGTVIQTKELGVGRTPESEALLREGRDLLKHGRYREALARAEKVLEIAPSDPHAQELKEECSRRLSQAEQVTMLLKQGTELFDRGKFLEARDAMEGVLAVEPAQADATRILEQANEGLDRREQLDKLIAEAEISLKHGRPDAAAVAYRRVLSMDPENKDAQRGLRKMEKGRTERPKAGVKTPVPGAPGGSRRGLFLTLGAVIVAGVAIVLFVVLPGKKPPVPAEGTTDTPASLSNENPVTHPAPSVSEPSAAPHQGEPAAASTPSVDIAALKKLVNAARLEMHTEKASLLKRGGKAATGTGFADAAKSETEGDRGRTSDDPAVVSAAVESYHRARDGYRRLNEEAEKAAALRNSADVSSGAMTQAKESVPGTDQARRSSAVYREASDAESSARNLYQSGDYAGARDGFEHARALYVSAADDVRAELSREKAAPPPTAPKTPEKKEPSRADRETDLRQTLETYKKSFEEGDTQTLAALRNLSADERKRSEEFFRNSENRSITITQSQLLPDLTHAKAELVQKFSSGDQEQSLTMEVTLDYAGGRWTIRSFSRK